MDKNKEVGGGREIPALVEREEKERERLKDADKGIRVNRQKIEKTEEKQKSELKHTHIDRKTWIQI